jgi:transcription termination/antitermination protein NusA
MAITEFSAALNQVASERNIQPQEVLDTLKEALVAAYKKDNPEREMDEVEAEIDPDTGEAKIVFEGKDVTPAGFGRIASQTAKQVILQKIREAEKKSIADEYKTMLGTMTQGYIFRIDKDTVIMDIGKTQGLMPKSEQIPSENYTLNQRYKVLIKTVTEPDSPGGATIILSRKDPKFIEALIAQEVPEIQREVVTIESIAREAGKRTKVAVSSTDPKIDPSGACIGQRGVRVQAVTDELNGEKIDIINYSPDADRFIAQALAPAHVIDVIIDQEKKSATVKVSDDQLSLAIGNEGENARLAAKLTGYRISINGEKVDAEKKEEVNAEE